MIAVRMLLSALLAIICASTLLAQPGFGADSGAGMQTNQWIAAAPLQTTEESSDPPAAAKRQTNSPAEEFMNRSSERPELQVKRIPDGCSSPIAQPSWPLRLAAAGFRRL